MKTSLVRYVIAASVPLLACGARNHDPSTEQVQRSAAPLEASPGGSAVAPRHDDVSPVASVGTHDGRAGMSLALPRLAARGDHRPDVSLEHVPTTGDARAGFGVGFRLDVPSIEITQDWGPPYTEDGLDRGMDPATGDIASRLAWNGERLVYIGRPDTRSGARVEYRFEKSYAPVRVSRFVKGGVVSALADDGAPRSIAFTGFLLEYPDGAKQIYTEEAAVTEGLRATGAPTRWPLRYDISNTGDVITYDYTLESDGRSYLTAVTFGGGRSVYRLDHSKRDDAPVSYAAGFAQGADFLYTKLTTLLDGDVMARWWFVYETFAGGARTLLADADVQGVAAGDFPPPPSAVLAGRDRLVGVYRAGRGAGALTRATLQEPLLRFAYTDWTVADVEARAHVFDYGASATGGFGPQGGSELLDANGDGILDVAELTPGAASVALRAGNGALDGDALVEGGSPLSVSVRDGAADPVRFDTVPGAQQTFLHGDFNGDAREDILKLTPDVTGGQTQIWLYAGLPGAGARFDQPLRAMTIDVLYSAFAEGRGQVVDLNGDGKDDLLAAPNDGVRSAWTALVSTTEFDAIDPAFVALTNLTFPFDGGPGWELDNRAYRFLDVNADGLTDLAVLHTSPSSSGVCIYENQGGLRATPAQNKAALLGPRLFGESGGTNEVCAEGYFRIIPGLQAVDNINALWLIDVDGDALADAVTLDETSSALRIWLSRGQAGFGAERSLPLAIALNVDPQNKWNTRTVDVDGDGLEEILVFEPDGHGSGRFRVIDFNRKESTNLLSPNVLVGFDEGGAYGEAFQYTTTTDETIRDRRWRFAAPFDLDGVPNPELVVKRRVIRTGAQPLGVTEYQYHRPVLDRAHADRLGFAVVDALTFGDASEESALHHVELAVDGTDADRVLADRVALEETSAPALTAAQSARITASATAFPRALEEVSLTSATWGEEPYAARVVLSRTAATWGTVPAVPSPRGATLVRQQSDKASACGSAGCDDAFASIVTFAYDDENRVTAKAWSRAGGKALYDVILPAAGYLETITYDDGAAARGNHAAIKDDTVTSSAGRLLAHTHLTYSDRFPLPATIAEDVTVDAARLRDLPTDLASRLSTSTTRTQTLGYDAFANVVDRSDDVGVIDHRDFDARGVVVLRATNALGQTTVSCFGTRECPVAGATGPAASLYPTLIVTAQGERIAASFDDLHRPETIVSSSGRSTEYVYHDATADRPERVLATERMTGSDAVRVRVYASRADGQPIASATAGGATLHVESYVVRNRRGDEVFVAQPYDVKASAAEVFATGSWPTPSSTSCPSPDGSCSHYDAIGRVDGWTSEGGVEVVRTTELATGREIDRDVARDGAVIHLVQRTVGFDDETYAIVDEGGNVIAFDRDAQGHLSATSVPGESTPRSVIFNSAGELVAYQLPGVQTHAWVRDARGRARDERTYSADGSAWESIAPSFDARDRVATIRTTSSSRPSGWDMVTFHYDSTGEATSPIELTGRLARTETNDLLTGEQIVERYAYDTEGRIVDSELRVAASSAPDEKAVRVYAEHAAFGVDGSVVSYSDPFGHAFRYERDASGDLTAIDWTPKGGPERPFVDTVVRNARGAIAGYHAVPSGLERTIDFDPTTSRLIGVRACTANCTHELQRLAYARRGDGYVLSESAAQPSRQVRYEYTARGELQAATRGEGRWDYQYGPGGETLSMNEGAARTFSRPAGSATAPLPEGYAHDPFGRVASTPAVRSIKYDPFGRIREISLPDRVVTYGYDAAGNRISRRAHAGADGVGSESWVVYPNALSRDDGVSRQSKISLEGHDVGVIVDGRPYALLDDQLGVTRAVVDASGATVATREYTPYGQAIAGASADAEWNSDIVFSFTGQQRDGDTGFVHMGARDYAPELGSFLTPDPYLLANPSLCQESPLECHAFTYVGHNPINFADEDGHARGTPGGQRGASSTRGRGSRQRPGRGARGGGAARGGRGAIDASSSTVWGPLVRNAQSARERRLASATSRTARTTEARRNYLSANIHVYQRVGGVRGPERHNLRFTTRSGIDMNHADAVQFATQNSGFMTRAHDSEVNALSVLQEHIDTQLNPAYGVNGWEAHIELFTERNYCSSCAGVVGQFLGRNPNVTIEGSFLTHGFAADHTHYQSSDLDVAGR